MKFLKTAIIFLITAIFIVVIIIFSNLTYKAKVTIHGNVFLVDVAETRFLLEKGLSGHKTLKSNEGMFFIFDKPDKYGFWMKDMSFPIDIIWINQDFKITYIEKSVSPDTYPKIYYPIEDSIYVLEILAGQSNVQNIKIGDFVKFETKAGKNY